MHLIVLCIYPLALLSGLAGPGCGVGRRWAGQTVIHGTCHGRLHLPDLPNPSP